MNILPHLVLLASVTTALAQRPGDTVTPATLSKLEWIQGEAPGAWEPGKLYILECWATWCGPCIAAIPHIDSLHDKYSSKGLRIIGVNVWEDGQEKVAAFVRGKADGMSYPVAYTGKGGAFEKDWLVPAGVGGIPHAFILKDGKVLLHTHPSQLSESLVEDLLAGGEREAKLLQEAGLGQLRKEQASSARAAFQEASGKSDVTAMESAFSDLMASGTIDDLAPLKIDLLLAKHDWSGLEAIIGAFPNSMEGDLDLQNISDRTLNISGVPESFRKFLITRLNQLNERSVQVHSYVILSRLQWSLGDQTAAKVSAKQCAENAKLVHDQNPHYPSAHFLKFADSVDKGIMPTSQQYYTWGVEAMKQLAPEEGR